MNKSIERRVSKLENLLTESNQSQIVVDPRWVDNIMPALKLRFDKMHRSLLNGDSIYKETIKSLIKDLEILDRHSYSEDDAPW